MDGIEFQTFGNIDVFRICRTLCRTLPRTIYNVGWAVYMYYKGSEIGTICNSSENLHKDFFKDVRLWDYVELWNQLQALDGHTINCNFLIYISLHSSLFCRRKSDNMWNSDVKWHKTVFMMLDCAIALLLRVVRKCAFWKDYLT